MILKTSALVKCTAHAIFNACIFNVESEACRCSHHQLRPNPTSCIRTSPQSAIIVRKQRHNLTRCPCESTCSRSRPSAGFSVIRAIAAGRYSGQSGEGGETQKGGCGGGGKRCGYGCR